MTLTTEKLLSGSSSLIFILLILAFFQTSAAAAILTVNNTSDTDNGACNQNCSLREAVGAAAEFDLINFAPALRDSPIQLSSQLIINKSLTIDGSNDAPITVNGSGTSRVFLIDATGRAVNVVFESLIIRDGNVLDAADGGGIYFSGNQGSSLTLLNCTVANNRARSGGGVRVFNLSYFNIFNSTISGNKSSIGTAGVDAERTRVIVRNSTISNNSALGIATRSAGGVSSIQGTLSLFNSTVYNNSSLSGDVYGCGGVLQLGPRPGPFSNSIIAGNYGGNPDFSGLVSAARYTLIGRYDGTLFGNKADGNIVGTNAAPVDPQLGELTNNGGSVETHAPLAGSSVINAGGNSYTTQPIDARGFARITEETVDMGAFESNSTRANPLVNVAGRVTVPTGAGLFRTRLKMTNLRGETKYAFTNLLGSYTFYDVPLYETVSLEVQSKRYRFAEQSVIVQNNSSNFYAQQEQPQGVNPTRENSSDSNFTLFF